MTSHDREFINRIINKVVEIDGGTLTTFSGDYEFYEQQRALNEKQQQAQFERQQAMLAKEIKFIERFKARASHAAQVQSRVKKLDKIERVEPPKRRQTVAFEFLPAPRSGEDVVQLKNVTRAMAAAIYDGLDFMIRRRERWCVMGVNGAGKSTLLKLVAGSSEPTRARWQSAAASRWAISPSTRWTCSTANALCFESLEDQFPQAGRARCARSPAASASPATMSRRAAGCCPGGEKARLVMARCCSIRRTSWCWTSRPTISTSPPRRC
jgi:ATPase subunit of ABC transporter with duplicated ATPase domains